MSDIAENFLLFQVKAEGHPGVLQIVVAAARVRLVGAQVDRGKNNGERAQRSQNPPADSAAGWK
jgi:hypothetical protein